MMIPKRKKQTVKSVEWKKLLGQIRSLVLSARGAVSRSVDTIHVLTNFRIGQLIVEHEQKGKERAEYGKKILEKLSANLTTEFGKGFSRSNLEYMRKFFLDHQNSLPLISQTASGESSPNSLISQTASWKLMKPKMKHGILASPFTLSWSHYVFLMGIKDESERKFYEIEACEQNWALRELKRQYNSSLYERLALSRNKKKVLELAQKGQWIDSPSDLIKQPLVLEFLGLDEKAKYAESDLESAIINKLEHFLLELGKGFLFEARQKRFTFDADHFYVDLVFYNRLLRCYVLIDLKIGKLTHQDLGQMQMYVNYFDRYVKKEDEHPTVGIILCKRKSDILVEITLPKNANIYASEYKLYLPSKQELKRKLLEWASEKE
jgi:predicted nuclease of restriction endonuclease-like (RecB) superfamily